MVLVCHFEMFAVGVRCLLFPSTREANSYFGEEMAPTFGEEKLVDTQFCHWLVSISLHSTGFKLLYLVRLLDLVYISC